MNRIVLRLGVSVMIILSLLLAGACDDDNEVDDAQTVTPSESPQATEEIISTPTQDIELEPVSEDVAATDEDTLPMRIISLAPSNTETLFALGLADQVVGVTKYCDYPPEAKEKDQIGGFKDVNMELVIEADPDLILAANIHKDSVVPELERRGFNVVTIAPGTLDEALEMAQNLGE